MNRFPLVFGGDHGTHDSGLKAFLLTHKVPVVSIKNTSKKDGKVSIKLDDASNEFNNTLLFHLDTALDDLRKRTSTALGLSPTNERLQHETARVFISQMDYTQDLLGFFIAPDVKDAIDKIIGEFEIQMFPSKHHKQLMTCLQFLDSDTERAVRVKVYTKSAHLLTCGQFKKWMDMRTKELLKPSQAFFDKKIQPSHGCGLTRIEVSMYFESHDQWIAQVDNQFKDAKYFCDQTLLALNKHASQLCYEVSLKDMVSSYFHHALSARTVVFFDKDVWVIAYYFNGKSYTYTGHEVNRTSKSGSMVNFLKRYLFPGQRCLVFSGELLGECKKKGGKMQLPISSLNEKHTEEYELKLDPVFSYHLDEDDLDEISIETADAKVKILLDIPDPNEEQSEEHKSEDMDYEPAPPKHPVALNQATIHERRHQLKRNAAPLPVHEVSYPKRLHLEEDYEVNSEDEAHYDFVQEQEEEEEQSQFQINTSGKPAGSHKKREVKQVRKQVWKEKKSGDLPVFGLNCNPDQEQVEMTRPVHELEKRKDKQPQLLKKTKAGAIIREVFDEDWIEDGHVIEGKKKRKTYLCLRCKKPGVKSNHRNVHACVLVD